MPYSFFPLIDIRTSLIFPLLMFFLSFIMLCIFYLLSMPLSGFL